MTVEQRLCRVQRRIQSWVARLRSAPCLARRLVSAVMDYEDEISLTLSRRMASRYEDVLQRGQDLIRELEEASSG